MSVRAPLLRILSTLLVLASALSAKELAAQTQPGGPGDCAMCWFHLDEQMQLTWSCEQGTSGWDGCMIFQGACYTIGDFCGIGEVPVSEVTAISLTGHVVYSTNKIASKRFVGLVDPKGLVMCEPRSAAAIVASTETAAVEVEIVI